MFRFSDLWRWDGTIGRGPYALIGLLAFALKHNLDRFVAGAFFQRNWGVFNYWVPLSAVVRITSLSPADRFFLGTMLLISLPFVWIGVSLTLKRLRAAGLPGWMVALFFLPFLNLAFFVLLCVLPSRGGEASELPPRGRAGALLDRLLPDHPWGSAAVAILITSLFGAAATEFSARLLTEYGWGLFTALPFCLGLSAVLLHGYHRSRSLANCLFVATLAPVLVGGLLLSFAVEGVICLVMALPIGLPLSLLGGVVGYYIQQRHWNRLDAPATLGMLLLLVPSMMGIEAALPQTPPLYAVRTALEINAPPERVWQQVIAFSEITEPPEWIFRAGIAWPMRAELHGNGPGAVRYCIFSTGAFVEPIEIWDEPRLLKFSVASNPRPMQELTPYGEINAAHLDGFLVSRAGQFRLERLADGRTRLEGTTWYQHGLWPTSYWRVWSDFLIHRIHLRVLRHIQRQAEQSTESPRSSKGRQQ
ncbi:MAG: hypothetical protein HY234_07265 [Acidobacteria bacterium]|nr:hypothetical protein [Acidobacteriota bacterium]MBI3662833.1 hypothetical protein [Acidobacteriota bacterium]